MSRDPRVYLEDILNAIRKIRTYTTSLNRESLRENELALDGVVRNLEVIGEAVKQLPEDLKSHSPNIEWKKIAGLRDILIHQYFGIDTDIVWDIVENKLSDLDERVRVILAANDTGVD